MRRRLYGAAIAIAVFLILLATLFSAGCARSTTPDPRTFACYRDGVVTVRMPVDGMRMEASEGPDGRMAESWVVRPAGAAGWVRYQPTPDNEACGPDIPKPG